MNPDKAPIARLRPSERGWADEIEKAEAEQDAEFFKDKEAT